MNETISRGSIRAENHKRTRFLLLHAILPIGCGALIYTLWRSSTLLVFVWYRSLGLDPWVVHSRLLARPLKQWIPQWVLFSAPDGLWVYSWTALMLLIWQGTKPSAITAAWICVGVVLGVSGEFGQALGVVPGTYDWLDLLTYLLAFVFALLVGRCILHREHSGDTAKIPAHWLGLRSPQIRPQAKRHLVSVAGFAVLILLAAGSGESKTDKTDLAPTSNAPATKPTTQVIKPETQVEAPARNTVSLGDIVSEMNQITERTAGKELILSYEAGRFATIEINPEVWESFTPLQQKAVGTRFATLFGRTGGMSCRVQVYGLEVGHVSMSFLSGMQYEPK